MAPLPVNAGALRGTSYFATSLRIMRSYCSLTASKQSVNEKTRHVFATSVLNAIPLSGPSLVMQTKADQKVIKFVIVKF